MSDERKRAYDAYMSTDRRTSTPYEAFCAGWEAAMRTAVPPNVETVASLQQERDKLQRELDLRKKGARPVRELLDEQASQPPSLLRQIAALAYDTSKAADDRIREIQALWEGAGSPPNKRPLTECTNEEIRSVVTWEPFEDWTRGQGDYDLTKNETEYGKTYRDDKTEYAWRGWACGRSNLIQQRASAPPATKPALTPAEEAERDWQHAENVFGASPARNTRGNP